MKQKNDNVYLWLGLTVLVVIGIFLIVFINGVGERSSARLDDLSDRERSAATSSAAPTSVEDKLFMEGDPSALEADPEVALPPPTLAGQVPTQIVGITPSAWLEADCGLTVTVDNRSSADVVVGIITDAVASELAAPVNHRARITFPMTQPPASVSLVGPAGEVLLVQPLNADACTPPSPSEGVTLGPAQELTELGADVGP